MTTSVPAPRYVAPATTGRYYRVIREQITIIATAEETGGAYSLFETRTPPGEGAPPHFQRNEEESFYVLDGRYEFRLGDEAIEVEAGGYVFVPRDTVHGFRNVGDGMAQMLIMTSPGGYHEHFFAEAGEPISDPVNPEPPAGPPDFDRVMAAASRYGIEILPPPE